MHNPLYYQLRLLVLPPLLVLASVSANACDYTVRDIGFIPHESPRYTLVVMSPSPVVIDDATKQLCRYWGMATLSLAPPNAGNMPVAIRDHHAEHPITSSIWLMDADRRCLHLQDIQDVSEPVSLEKLIAQRFSTPTMQHLRLSASTTFAQVLLLDAQQSREEEAHKAAASLKELEPMLPRPVTLPAEVVVVSPERRESESLLLWALGIDSGPIDEAVLVVLYGRGRLAGPALLGEAITHPALVAQLALVGESCECETDRAWLAERTIPFYWDEEDDRTAKSYLGFDPGNQQVQDDVQRVIKRGQRLGSIDRPDTIERIVSSYMESHVDGYQPRRLEIPVGGPPKANVTSTVIQGDGWDFAESKTDAKMQTDQTFGVGLEETDAADDIATVVFRPSSAATAAHDFHTSSSSSVTPAVLVILALVALAISIAIWKQFA